MSEAVTGGVAVAAVGPCLAIIGLAAAGAYATYRSLKWLSEQGQREMERLEKELAAPPTHATTKEARQAFEETFKQARSKAAQLPSLKDHAETVARMLALKGSPLGAFTGKAQWAQICRPGLTQTSFGQVLDQAAKEFTRANALAVVQSIGAVAKREGFKRQRLDRREERQGRKSLVLEDGEGRALIATVTHTEDGAQITLDLTGFGDGSCLGVMDRILDGLAEEGVRLDDLRRRSHYRREGVTPVVLTDTPPLQRTPQRFAEPSTVQVPEAARSRERLRRQQQSRIATLKQR
jgi:hypothetical protein